MITSLSPKMATLIKENPDLIDLLVFLIKEANFVGQTGKSVSRIQFIEKKKNWLVFRFFDEYYLEWEENT